MVNILRVTANTVLKTKRVDSELLGFDEKVNLPVGDYPIDDFEEIGNYLLVDFTNVINRRKQWLVFKGHIDTLVLTPYPENTDRYEPKKKDAVNIPGLSYQVGLSEPIIKNGNFVWAEATKNGSRIPQNVTITNNIITVAARMEEVRALFSNSPITVTSWYRDPASNRRVGGASKSTHMSGHAIDFIVTGFTPKQVQRQLETFWKDGMGYGHTFTHLDCRGYRARWNYGS